MNLDHLDEEFQPLALKSDKERIERIQSLKWIGYPRANKILQRMEWLFGHARTDRMPNMLLVGESMSGKTSIAKRMLALHPAQIGRSDQTDHRPIIYLQLLGCSTPKEFLQTVLESVNAFYPPSAKLPRLMGMLEKIIPAMGTKLLIIDELDHLVSGTRKAQRDLRDQIKLLGNELQLPIVAIGTMQSRSAFETDQQLSNRFQPFELPSWRYDKSDQAEEDLQSLEGILQLWETTCPLRMRSQIVNDDCIEKIHEDTLGYMGYMMRYLIDASEHAIKTGQEKITIDTFSEMTFYFENAVKNHRREAV
ncbi:type II secretory pathway predicted ATPase ExeA [Herbaspirillum sp. 1173]|uniref:TniB family NTP-binding protein n=1 Tax=Herbaspirillum sp. 1173 TaxID=2817734 RepID=UPI00286610D8|nr:TniB family NTP-binding protein [Herbaspirillum sp. 1173]MDR6742938.1 type II secretory pathway predicted ATPase ExeA [Herbaspirillum sp. 1173]